MKIRIVTNTFGKYHRQNVAAESWLHLKKMFPQVELLNLQFEDEEKTFKDHYEGIPTKFCLEHCSRLYTRGKKKLPLVWEIITKGFDNGHRGRMHYDEITGEPEEELSDYVIFTNSDVILLPRLIEYILAEKPDCMAGPRLDIEEVASFQDVLDNKVKPVRVEIAGYDFFVFSKEFFDTYAEHFASSFLLGKPLFDVDYAGLMVLLGKKYHIANSYPMMALHIHHGIDSVTTECPEKDFNHTVHARNPLFQVANNIMFFNLQNNLCRRKPWGAFIQPTADEQKTQKAFFDTMNIHHENTIQFIQ